MRIRARRDIGSPLAIAIPRDTLGTVLELRGVRHVIVSFANGRTLQVTRTALTSVPQFWDRPTHP